MPTINEIGFAMLSLNVRKKVIKIVHFLDLANSSIFNIRNILYSIYLQNEYEYLESHEIE